MKRYAAVVSKNSYQPRLLRLMHKSQMELNRKIRTRGGMKWGMKMDEMLGINPPPLHTIEVDSEKINGIEYKDNINGGGSVT